MFSFKGLVRSSLLSLGLLSFCSSVSLAAPVHAKNPFCSTTGCAQTRVLLRQMCDYIVENKATYPTIYVGGYYMRDLVDGYEIFGTQKYLDTAISYGDYLLRHQMSNGFWPSGYGTVYLADTGSALGLFVALYNHVDHHRQQEYLSAVQRYTSSIEKSGLINADGGLGTGWRHVKNGVMTEPLRSPYTLASALTGGEIFTWAYHVTKQEKDQQVAYRALEWVLSTMRSDGNIPMISPAEDADWSKRADPKVFDNIWNNMTYGTAAYVGEGVLSFALYTGTPAYRARIGKAVKPNIEFLLRTQLPDGTWSKLGPASWDRTRSPGIVNYLTWYYDHVDKDPRVASAVRKFDVFIIKPENGQAYGLLNDGAKPQTRREENAFNSATSLTGRAVADIVSPGVDARW